MNIGKLAFEHRPISEHLVLLIEGSSFDEHTDARGELIECFDEHRQPLHAAFVFSDALKAVVACVFNRQFWTHAQAKRWLSDNLAAAKSQAVALTPQKEAIMSQQSKRAIIGSMTSPKKFVGGAREAEVRRIFSQQGFAAALDSLRECGETVDQLSPGLQRDLQDAEIGAYVKQATGYVAPEDVAELVDRVKGASTERASNKRLAENFGIQGTSQADVQALVDRVRGRQVARRDVQQLVESIKPGATVKE